jgi:hypothetical protein
MLLLLLAIGSIASVAGMLAAAGALASIPTSTRLFLKR